MTGYVLDTDVLSDFVVRRPDVIRAVTPLFTLGLGTTIISVEEQFAGWYSALRRAKTDQLLVLTYESMTRSMTIMSRLHLLTFSMPALRRFENLVAQKLNVKKHDLRIAAITLEHGATLVTRNLQDFRRVPGLQLVTV